MTTGRLRDRWKRHQARRNPVVRRCPACGSELRRYLHGWAWELHMVSWLVFCNFAVWDTGVSIAAGLPIVLVLAIPYNIATNRLYEHYWHWRHPLRCEKGGHAEPLPGGS